MIKKELTLKDIIIEETKIRELELEILEALSFDEQLSSLLANLY